jgi:plasmid stabilization system protein ParE
VAQVIVTPRARRDVDEALSVLNLPDDAWARIARSLRVLETFPLAGPELAGRWAPARFVLGPWSWMVLLYDYDESSDCVYVVAMHDGRSAASPTAMRREAAPRSEGSRVVRLAP